MPILDTCQWAVNRQISESTAAKRRVAELEGRAFAIEFEGLSLRVVLRARDASVDVTVDPETAADASVKGTPLDLLGLVGPDPLRLLRNSRAQLTGNVQVAEGFAEVLRLARPELEGLLAPWVGDIAANKFGNATRGLLDWLGKAGRALELNLSEYLQEEAALIPGALQAKAFYSDVERLRDDVARTEQRLERIARAAAGRR